MVKDAGGRPLHRRPAFVVGCLVVAWWLIAAIGWRWAGLDPFGDTGVNFAPPSAAHWFGTDRIGRDVFARVMAGAQTALVVGPLGAVVGTLLGTALGLWAGAKRGWVDQVLMRTFDVFYALPAILLLIVVVAAFGSSMGVLAGAIAVFVAPGVARVVRAAVLVEMQKDYVATATLQGESDARLMLTELLPNVWPQALVQGTFALASAIFALASLSFLGLASAAPSPDWGLAVYENRAYLQGAWWTLVFPCVAIASLIVAVTLISDSLKEVLRR